MYDPNDPHKSLYDVDNGATLFCILATAADQSIDATVVVLSDWYAAYPRTSESSRVTDRQPQVPYSGTICGQIPHGRFCPDQRLGPLLRRASIATVSRNSEQQQTLSYPTGVYLVRSELHIFNRQPYVHSHRSRWNKRPTTGGRLYPDICRSAILIHSHR